LKKTFFFNEEAMRKTIFVSIDFTLSPYRHVFIRKAENIFGAISSLGGIRNILMSIAILIGREHSINKFYSLLINALYYSNSKLKLNF
jgi:hypothetical protein